MRVDTNRPLVGMTSQAQYEAEGVSVLFVLHGGMSLPCKVGGAVRPCRQVRCVIHAEQAAQTLSLCDVSNVLVASSGSVFAECDVLCGGGGVAATAGRRMQVIVYTICGPRWAGRGVAAGGGGVFAAASGCVGDAVAAAGCDGLDAAYASGGLRGTCGTCSYTGSQVAVLVGSEAKGHGQGIR